MEGMCVDARAPAVMTISGFTFHPVAAISSSKGWYFAVLLLMVSRKKWSLQYVNSMNSMVRD